MVRKQPTRIYEGTNETELKLKKTTSAARQAFRLKNNMIATAKKPGASAKDEMSKDMKARAEAANKMKGYELDPKNYSMTSQGAEKLWLDTVNALGAQKAYGLDDDGMKNRKKALEGKFRTSAHVRTFVPFIVSRGVLRGGETGHMTEEGHGQASIPTNSHGRELVSCRGKYVHPMKYPAARIIKYTRGSWGNARKLFTYESI